MQNNFTPRPLLQPNQRPTGSAVYGRSGVQVPQRGAPQPQFGNPVNPVDRAVVHTGSSAVSTSFGHFTEAPTQHTQTYASATQAMFAADLEPQTPYEQLYHIEPAQPRAFHFPFRAFMIVLVVGAISFSAFAVYNSIASPSPVNADQQEIAP